MMPTIQKFSNYVCPSVLDSQLIIRHSWLCCYYFRRANLKWITDIHFIFDKSFRWDIFTEHCPGNVDGYKIEEIRPSDFNMAAKINTLEVFIISYRGEKKSIKREGEDQVLKQFIATLQKDSVSN